MMDKQKLKEIILKPKHDKISIPRRVQNTLPFHQMLSNGILEVGNNVYSRTINLGNINYTASKENDKKSIFNRYSTILNALPNDVNMQLYLTNEKINKEDLIEDLSVDTHRKNEYIIQAREYNEIMSNKISEAYSATARKNIKLILSASGSTVESADNKIKTLVDTLEEDFKKMGSRAEKATLESVIEGFHTFYNPLNKEEDFSNIWGQGLSVNDIISPSHMKFNINHYQMGSFVGRVMFFKSYPSKITDAILSDLLSLPYTMQISIHIEPRENSKVIKAVSRQLTHLNANKMSYTRKGGITLDPYVPADLKRSIEETNHLLEEMQQDKKLFFVSIYVNVIAVSKELLDRRTQEIQAKCRKHLVTCETLHLQQEEGLASLLPVGVDKLSLKRALLTDSLAVFMPFTATEIVERNGYYYGINQITKSLIILNRKKMRNFAGFVIGTPRSGKTFKVKWEALNTRLRHPQDSIIFVDPDNDYTPFVEYLGGEVVRLGYNAYINAMDLTKDYGLGKDPVTEKSIFILSFFETIKGKIEPAERTIIDRCVKEVYKELVEHDYDKNYMPTLQDLLFTLKEAPEVEVTKALITPLEIYVTGSLDLFSKKTNVDLGNKMTSFNIFDISDSKVRQLAMMTICDFIWNRLCQNFIDGIHTWINVDEFQTFYGADSVYMANFFNEFFRRSQKKGGIPTGITQNITAVLSNEHSKLMFQNSEFFLLFRQSGLDKAALKELLKMTDDQLERLDDPDEGEGILVYRKSIIPFKDIIPAGTKTYKALTTKFSDRQEALKK